MKQKVYRCRKLFFCIFMSMVSNYIYSVHPGENIWHVAAETSTQVDQLLATLVSCCASLTADMAGTFTALAACCACNPSAITESMIITESGTYCVANDFSGSITIMTDNVEIDLNGHTISSGGITISGNNVLVKNGRLVSGTGVTPTGTRQNILLQDLQILGGTTSISATTVTNLLLERININGATSGIAVTNCDACIMKNCKVVNISGGTGYTMNATVAAIFECELIGCSAYNCTTGFSASNLNCVMTDCSSDVMTTGFDVPTNTVNVTSVLLKRCFAKNCSTVGFTVGSTTSSQRYTFKECEAENCASGFIIIANTSLCCGLLENCVANTGSADGFLFGGTNRCAVQYCNASGFANGFRFVGTIICVPTGCAATNNTIGFNGTTAGLFFSDASQNGTNYVPAAALVGGTSAFNMYVQSAGRLYGDNLTDV